MKNHFIATALASGLLLAGMASAAMASGSVDQTELNRPATTAQFSIPYQTKIDPTSGTIFWNTKPWDQIEYDL